MRVTLKRADFYARTALKAATEIKYEPSARLSIYAPALTSDVTDGISAEFIKARDKMLMAHDQSLLLINATYAIRAQLATANATHGISVMLTNNARLGAQEARLRALLKTMEAETRGETSAYAVLAKAAAIRDQPSDRYGLGRSDDSVSMTAFTEDDVASVRTQLKRIVDERAGINDALTAANVSNSITLDATTVSVLRKAEILPVE